MKCNSVFQSQARKLDGIYPVRLRSSAWLRFTAHNRKVRFRRSTIRRVLVALALMYVIAGLLVVLQY